ncbi:MAG: YajQ family cyclic di-GMP-binding protein [Permianibacter sp.]
MPSFDVVSEIDRHELTNAIDQAKRELETRFDFRGTAAAIEPKELVIKLIADSEFQLQQLGDIVTQKLTKRGISLGCVELSEPEPSGKIVQRNLTLKEGIEQALAKKISNLIKDAKLKVQTQINGDKLRVTGKKRDDLQEVIALLRSSEIEQPLQYNNFRD